MPVVFEEDTLARKKSHVGTTSAVAQMTLGTLMVCVVTLKGEHLMANMLTIPSIVVDVVDSHMFHPFNSLE